MAAVFFLKLWLPITLFITQLCGIHGADWSNAALCSQTVKLYTVVPSNQSPTLF